MIRGRKEGLGHALRVWEIWVSTKGDEEGKGEGFGTKYDGYGWKIEIWWEKDDIFLWTETAGEKKRAE